MSEMRYYYGEASELEGMTREEAEGVTLESYEDAEENYEEMISEIYGEVRIGELTWDAGRVLREMDPIAFRCGVSDAYEEIDLDDFPADEDE